MSRDQVTQRLGHPQIITSTILEEIMSRQNATVELDSKVEGLCKMMETLLNSDHPNVQAARMYEAPPPDLTHAPCAPDFPTCPEYPTNGHPDPGQTCNELGLSDDPFADNSYPMEPIHGKVMAHDGNKGRKSKKAPKKKKNLDGVEGTNVDASSTFPDVPQVQYPEIGYTTTDGAMAEPGGGRLHLPCIACHHQWIVRFKSPTIPSEVIFGEHEKAMGFTICTTGCGVITTDALMGKGIEPDRITMIPLCQSTAEQVRRSLYIDAPVITSGNQVLFFQQSQISDMTRFNGTVTSFDCDLER